MIPITLYRCSRAIVRGAVIRCDSHRLGMHPDGTVSLKKLIRGEEMCFSICQTCPDFDDMGPTPKKVDRGWTPDQYERALIRSTPRKRRKS